MLRRTSVPPHIIEFILINPISGFAHRCNKLCRRPLSSVVKPSTAPSPLSKFAGLIYLDQELKPTGSDAEAHNYRLSSLRGALGTRDLSHVQKAFEVLVEHQSHATIMERDYQEISWLLVSHYSSCSHPNHAMVGITEMALHAAARGHAAGLKACLLLYLKVGDSRGILSVFSRFRQVFRDNIDEGSKYSTVTRTSDASDKSPSKSHYGPSGPDMADIVLVMIAAHGMEDRFNDALDHFLALPINIRVPAAKVQSFCRIYVNHDGPLSEKIRKWTEEFVLLRLVSKESSLDNYVSDLGEDKQISSLTRLYTSIISRLKEVGGRLVVDTASSRKSHRIEGARKTVTMPNDSWGTFVEAFFKCHRPDLVETLWNDVLEMGVIPTRRMWNSLLDGYGRQRNCDMAKSIWNRMLDAGVVPDEISYGAMISAYFQGSRADEAYALFQQFRDVRLETPAGRESLTSSRMLRLFNIVLHGLCTSAMDNTARSILKEMSEQGPKPDIVSYNILLRHYERIGDMKGLGGILRSLKPAGVQPDVHSFTTILSALYKAGKQDAHTKTLEIMKAMDIQPNVATYSAIIHFLVRQGGEENLRKAGDLLGQMENEPNKELRPNEVTYTGVLAGIHRDTTISPQNVKIYTAELLDRMHSQGKSPNRTTYHILIKACLENPLPVGLETALGYYHEMEKRGIALLSDTWYVILAGLLRRGDIPVAGEVLKDLFRSGHEPNSALTTLILRIQKEITARKL